MFLKQLESVGFKSFAEKINVDFVSGVTAVVGPNGSGKSNITDAIRWVLGEQSVKSLRGSRMEDIIFQGSDTRKALNFAEVTLVLDNHDQSLPLEYEEVSVTRRVYRSGESEFYINKQSCRLKDIVDLFMDSGLGREAFSIISQGKVEEILSSKPEERRTIFEEAAGVLKYKQRKKKAEYKLEETQENLNRVEDIIHEIEKQVGPLEQQANAARQYLEWKEELKEKEITLLVTEIAKLHGSWKNLSAELEQERKMEQQLKKTIQQKSERIETERKTLKNLDDDIDSLQTKLLKAAQNLEKFEGQKQLFEERTKHFGERKTELEANRQQTAERIGNLHDQVVKENKKLADLDTARDKTREKIQQLRAQLRAGKESIAEQIEDRKSDYIELLNKQAAKRNERQSVQQQLEQISGKKSMQAEKFKGLLSSREELEGQLQRVHSEWLKQDRLVKGKNATIVQLKKDLDTKRSAFEEAQAKLFQGYQYIEKLKSRKEMLEEMKEDFQGFFQGVKAVLKAREDQTLHGIHGAVIELANVPKDYITAIETVLGGQAQHIVVTDNKAARNAINWLKKMKQGRATFLPLGSIQARFVTRDMLAKVRSHSGFVGVASDLVSMENTYKIVADHLMGHVLIAKTLKDANDIAAKTKGRYRVVTLEGDVVNPGGSMTGGASKKTNQSLFSREKDLEEATNKLADYQSKVEDFERKVQQQKRQIGELEKQLDTEEADSSAARHSLNKLESSYKELEVKKNSLDGNLSIYDQDKQQFEQDIKQLVKREENLVQDLEKLASDLEAAEQEISRLTEQEAGFQENKENIQQELHDRQVELAEQEERRKNQLEKTKTLQLQLEEMEAQYDEYSQELRNLNDVNETPVTEEELERSIQYNKVQKQQTEEDIEHRKQERGQLTKEMHIQKNRLKEEEVRLQGITNSIQQKEVHVNRLDVELDNRLTRLENEYMITFEKANESYPQTDDIASVQAEVDRLKQRIEQLGTVNLGAVEEYQRVRERYDFLTEQRDDLTAAKGTLHTVIAEMDEEMKNLFQGTFNQIREEFTEVFQQLFGGGHAELQLTDPESILDTGVEIIAQPPGKRLQHLGLLSGGERALTAIALLFSILRVRPVPFCVLDEVEAALDEANVARFAKYVKLYSEKTQFIVITHRKGTMEEADVLYGVTMQESGVSRLVSVRLEETQDLIET
ncbi:chromosome segregation protein SMC [Virgibacillus xinjiangensis]|uniref:Chromosome partition protein Smc n=1 Tax=Virgibacillus xinjiangensis TaxID=393090 RepID=A0ABV7CV11_9BACI